MAAEDEKDLVAKNGARIVAGKHVKNAVDDEDREKKSTAADNLLDNYMGNMITIALILDEKRKREEQQMKDDELHQVWEICAEALERNGWDSDNAELSIRAYDDNLKQNVDSDTVCEPEPCGTEHPYYYEF